jgi:hypothetical protein
MYRLLERITLTVVYKLIYSATFMCPDSTPTLQVEAEEDESKCVFIMKLEESILKAICFFTLLI